jgi:hypothetical protein
MNSRDFKVRVLESKAEMDAYIVGTLQKKVDQLSELIPCECEYENRHRIARCSKCAILEKF